MAVPVISGINATSSNGSVTITWQTDVPAETHAAIYFGPAKHCSWNWQLTGTVDTSAPAQVYDFDAFDNNAPLVSQLRGSGVYCIAYFSAGSWEDWRPDANDFPVGVRGSNLDGWAGEKWLDVRQLAILRPIMAARADVAKAKGFDAIEWDNVDCYLQSTGFALTEAHQTAYNKMLAQVSHERGLAAFLKNDPGQVSILQPYFEGSVAEEPYQWSEAASYMAFATANKPVLICEYRDQDVTVANQNDANTRGYSLIRHNLNLNTKYVQSYVVNPAPAVVLGGNGVKSSFSPTTSHSLTFDGLTDGQTYGFLASSTNIDGTTYDTTPRTFIASGTGGQTSLPPTANSGADQSINVSSTTIGGTDTDPQSQNLTLLWSQVSGPSTATIVSPSSATTVVSGLISGIYVFRKSVTNEDLLSDTDDIQVTVSIAAEPLLPEGPYFALSNSWTLVNRALALQGNWTF